ncbi:transporter-domain-containing protein [Paramyrothecium foliicola]|nr:transporter-domain-containing protein [Paramyrothecium foliicola]
MPEMYEPSSSSAANGEGRASAADTVGLSSNLSPASGDLSVSPTGSGILPPYSPRSRLHPPCFNGAHGGCLVHPPLPEHAPRNSAWDTLHDSMPYRLTNDHLLQARQEFLENYGHDYNEDDDDDNETNATSPRIVEDLSCEGQSRFGVEDAEYHWSSEVCFDGESFLQTQEIAYTLDTTNSGHEIEMTACPHQHVRISLLHFESRGELVRVQLPMAPEYVDGQREEIPHISPLDGDLRMRQRMTDCPHCLTDVTFEMGVSGGQLHTRYISQRIVRLGVDGPPSTHATFGPIGSDPPGYTSPGSDTSDMSTPEEEGLGAPVEDVATPTTVIARCTVLAYEVNAASCPSGTGSFGAPSNRVIKQVFWKMVLDTWYGRLGRNRLDVYFGNDVGLEGGSVAVYVAETIERHINGNLVSLYQLIIALGEFLGYAVAAIFLRESDNWRWILEYSLLFSSIMEIGVLFLPERPSLLDAQGKDSARLQSWVSDSWR